MTSSCCAVGFEISNNFYAGPLENFRKTRGIFYEENPVMSRCVFITLSFFDGLTKPFFFPIYMLVGLVAFPIIAIVQASKKEIDDDVDFFTHKSSDYMKAWTFSLLATAGLLTVMILSSTYMPLIGTGMILASAFTASVAIHVFRAARTPSMRETGFEFIKVPSDRDS